MLPHDQTQPMPSSMLNVRRAGSPHWLVGWWIILAAVFISSDIIAIHPGGFTLRPADLLMALAGVAALPDVVGGLKCRWPLGFGKLVLWTFFVLVFVPNTPFLLRNVGYAAWLLLNVAFVFSAVQFIDTLTKVRFVLRGYAYSFGIMAAFGLLQFFLPFVHINPPLVQQWWIDGLLARINGLSYEPSFFAAYMAGGWVFIVSLAKLKSTLLSRRESLVLVVLTSTTLFLSGSRFGWGIMLIWIALNLLSRKVLAVVTISLLIGASTSWYLMNKYQVFPEDLEFLISGTGIMGTSRHSLDPRMDMLQDTFRVFQKNPILGVSLGGIVPAIGNHYGHLIVRQEDAKLFEGQSSTVEVLAATGILGFPFYASYMIGLFRKPWRFSKQSKALRAMVWSFVAIMGVMQFSGNILQGFVWMHIALLSAAYSVICQNAGPPESWSIVHQHE